MMNDPTEQELVEQCASIFKKSSKYAESADLNKEDCKKLLLRADEVFKKNPHNARTLGMCAMVFDTLKKTDKAIECLEKILAPEANANPVIRRRSMIYLAILKDWPTE